jgi:hypothetical protein
VGEYAIWTHPDNRSGTEVTVRANRFNAETQRMQYRLLTLRGDEFEPDGEAWVDGERLRDPKFLQQQQGQAGPSLGPGAGPPPRPDPDAVTGTGAGAKKKPSSIKVAMHVARKVVTSCWR